jgi:protein archease
VRGVPAEPAASTLFLVSTRNADEQKARDKTVRRLHRGDLKIEAWALTREACIAEAVRALVGSFLGRTIPPATGTVSFDVTGSTDTELLRAVLHGVILRLALVSEIPTLTRVRATATGLRLRCDVVTTGAIIPIGAIPKAVSKDPVRCERTRRGWWCSARIDV